MQSRATPPRWPTRRSGAPAVAAERTAERPFARPGDAAAARRDEILVARALEGDLDAFNQLVEAYQDLCHFALVARLVPDPDQASDAVQEAFFSAYRNLALVPGGRRSAAGSTRIAVNAAMDLQRARKRRPVSPYPELEDEVVAAAGRSRDRSGGPHRGLGARPRARRGARGHRQRPAGGHHPVRRRGLRLRRDRPADRRLARHREVPHPPGPAGAPRPPRRPDGTVPKLRPSEDHAARPAPPRHRCRGSRRTHRCPRRRRPGGRRSDGRRVARRLLWRLCGPRRRPPRDPGRHDGPARPRPAGATTASPPRTPLACGPPAGAV